jgi:tetratricopeptide (TPR) repeat protein
MKKIVLTLILCLLLPALTAGTKNSLEQTMNRAKANMYEGKYNLAIRAFTKIYKKSSNNQQIRREAKYFIGFCFVKKGELWDAINAYTIFIELYKDSNSDLIPEALYALGRTYESVGKIAFAKKTYKKCVVRFPYSELADKSENRLDVIGGENHSGANKISCQIKKIIDSAKKAESDANHDKILMRSLKRTIPRGIDLIALSKAFYSESRQKKFLKKACKNNAFRKMHIREVIKLAKTAQSYSTRDKILVSRLENVVNGQEFILLSKSFGDESRQKKFLKEVVNTTAFRRMSTQDMVKLAKTGSYKTTRDLVLAAGMKSVRSGKSAICLIKAFSHSDIRDKQVSKFMKSSAFRTMTISETIKLSTMTGLIRVGEAVLIEAAQKIAKTPEDFHILAKAVMRSNDAFDKINKLAKRRFDDYAKPHLSASISSEIKIEKKTTEEQNKKIKNSANDPYQDLKIDRAKYDRIATFIKAVDSRKGIDTAFKGLKESDLTIPAVKTYVKKYRSLQKFQKLHNN